MRSAVQAVAVTHPPKGRCPAPCGRAPALPGGGGVTHRLERHRLNFAGPARTACLECRRCKGGDSCLEGGGRRGGASRGGSVVGAALGWDL